MPRAGGVGAMVARRLHASDQQTIACSSARHAEQLPLGLVHVFEVGVIRDRLDPAGCGRTSSSQAVTTTASGRRWLFPGRHGYRTLCADGMTAEGAVRNEDRPFRGPPPRRSIRLDGRVGGRGQAKTGRAARHARAHRRCDARDWRRCIAVRWRPLRAGPLHARYCGLRAGDVRGTRSGAGVRGPRQPRLVWPAEHVCAH